MGRERSEENPLSGRGDVLRRPRGEDSPPPMEIRYRAGAETVRTLSVARRNARELLRTKERVRRKRGREDESERAKDEIARERQSEKEAHANFR